MLPNEVKVKEKPTFHSKVEEVFMNMDFYINSKYYKDMKKL